METSILQQALEPMAQAVVTDLQATILSIIPIIVPVFAWLIAISVVILIITNLIKSAADSREREVFMQSDYYIDNQDKFDF